MELYEIAVVSAVILAVGIAIIFFMKMMNLLPIVLIISAIPIALYLYLDYRKTKEIEKMFPYFITDVTEVVRAGMPLTQAMKYLSKNEYGELSKHIRKISAKIDLGVPLSKALTSFGEESKSKIVKRAIATIIKVEEYGGNLVNVLNNVVESIRMIDKLKSERELLIYGSVTQCYVIFLIFLGIMVAMYKFLFPMLSMGVGSAEALIGVDYTQLFTNLALIQALLSGIVIGKITEGKLLSGLKHSVVLGIVSYAVASLLAI
ncbi:MAG: type II secretion system F family protein [Candidatus Parvarchaeota archaeon]|nr:type II secretion system F family protein [Candidatus Jingweiarchaeum tengchongense]MCW1298461.1 type II secretion system F family protein [Candidatus Jingweiarchaeum tengchongense]MCW1300553.1 type II secretion system F family protein [Candidatus Jingweiarchaeum tengchongense]MCW1304972.1 type II secretion system F family protein [Candidatus Jingweiarchaeum tengchongense]MCW1309303.1 type II secretion system F family protein [Candidatus Jingweiarchaeum tengchongense]